MLLSKLVFLAKTRMGLAFIQLQTINAGGDGDTAIACWIVVLVTGIIKLT
jgi:hypothetical protein